VVVVQHEKLYEQTPAQHRPPKLLTPVQRIQIYAVEKCTRPLLERWIYRLHQAPLTEGLI